MTTENVLIQYGDFAGSTWHSLKGLDDPKFKQFKFFLDYLNWNPDYKLYVTGGIVEGWETRDLDLVLMGPYMPSVIKSIFKDLIGIGFKLGTFVDIKYFKNKEDLFKFEEHMEQWKVTNNVTTRWTKGYEYSNVFIREDVEKTIPGKMVDGLLERDHEVPFVKQVENYKQTGYIYKNPIQLK